MYRPTYTINENQQLSLELIKNYPLGLLISNSTVNELEFSYLPFYLTEEAGQIYLISHCSKSNPQWKTMDNKEAIVCFQGPNRYISPTMYHTTDLNVPTWNYAVVHAHGTVEILTDGQSLNKILHEATHIFESLNETNWKYDIPASLQVKLEAGIIGIKMKVTKLESKFKLSLNRNQEDYNAVVNFLKNSNKSTDHDLLSWMQKT